MIYKDVVDILKDALSRFKGVKYVRYTGDDLINQQQNYETIQCWIDDVSFHQFNLTTNIVKAEYEVYILGFPTEESGNTTLDVQDKCYDVAINVLAYIDTLEEFQGIVSVYDYSILTLSRFSEQSNAGVKLSIILQIPNGVNLCELDEKFGEPYSGDTDTIIDITTDEVGTIDLNPIKLPTNKNKC